MHQLVLCRNLTYKLAFDLALKKAANALVAVSGTGGINMNCHLAKHGGFIHIRMQPGLLQPAKK